MLEFYTRYTLFIQHDILCGFSPLSIEHTIIPCAHNVRRHSPNEVPRGTVLV